MVEGSFKPLSGIIFARTGCSTFIVGNKVAFQTPVGNYLRAHVRLTCGPMWKAKFQTPVGNYLRAHPKAKSLPVQVRRFKPLSGIIFARTWMENRVGTANPAGFKPLSGIIFARTAPRSFGRMVGPFVSNPCRELSSRAPRANDIARHTQRRFQTPVGNYLRAHLCRVRVFVRAQQFQTPVGNYLRAHMSSAWTTHALLMFQTPVGNYLRAHLPKVQGAKMETKFQTPVGNYLRAHRVRVGMSLAGNRFQTPVGNYLRAHPTPKAPKTRILIRFQTPVGNYLRAHQKWNCGQIIAEYVSNPCRELSSRAPRKNESRMRRARVSNPCRELSSRAHNCVSVNRVEVAGFKPLSGIIFARTRRRLAGVEH